MAIIRQESGCKVGWVTYDNEAEAREAGVKARAEAIEMASRGYDFGYQSPGEVRQGRTSQYRDGKFDPSIPVVMLDEWTVTTP
jgi:hypothetical protein